VHTWWPDTPGTVRDVLFLHSPGWLDPDYLGNLSSFDAAFVLDLGDGTLGVLGVAVRYHDAVKREVPKPERLPRYRRIATSSSAFTPTGVDTVLDGDLLVTWLTHLLVLSMLQHPGRKWAWGRFVLVHAARNTDQVDAGDRYRSLLADDATFGTSTIEQLLDASVLPSTAALRERFVPDSTLAKELL
ncbi:MAG TPA: hypothetical protein VFU93_00415, partial [Acidimicrobiales bacterium]|nr:hypothetical protein [Acidimicrobiales bacterium]